MKAVMNGMFVCRLNPLSTKRGREVLHKTLPLNHLANINLNGTFEHEMSRDKKAHPTQNIWHKKHVGASLVRLLRLLPLLACDYCFSPHYSWTYTPTHTAVCLWAPYQCLTVLHASAKFDFSGEKKKLRITEIMGASLLVCGQVSEHSLTSIQFTVILI